MRALVQQLSGVSGDGKVWHSTYYTMPRRWTGPTVLTVVDLIHEQFPHLFSTPADELFRKQKRESVLAADAVICISQTTLQDLQQFYGRVTAKTHVVSLACSPAFRVLGHAEGASAGHAEKPFLLYVGDHQGHHKNFLSVLRAYSCWSQRKEFNLVTVGVPWSEGQIRYMEGLGIADRVHLVTDADDDTLCQLYNRASIFVYPSLWEGFGIPLLEAMACGCPVVASRIPSSLEVAGKCAIYFEPSDVDELLAALDVASVEGRNATRVQQGLERVQRFSWDQSARQTLEIYRALSHSS
jgi:glycosyltransferase involved in cell wall biosynthesis